MYILPLVRQIHLNIYISKFSFQSFTSLFAACVFAVHSTLLWFNKNSVVLLYTTHTVHTHNNVYSVHKVDRISCGLMFSRMAMKRKHLFVQCVFTCVSYAEARNSYRLDVRPSVCLSVRPSHAGTLSKRLNILSCFLHHTIAHSF